MICDLTAACPDEENMCVARACIKKFVPILEECRGADTATIERAMGRAFVTINRATDDIGVPVPSHAPWSGPTTPQLQRDVPIAMHCIQTTIHLLLGVGAGTCEVHQALDLILACVAKTQVELETI